LAKTLPLVSWTPPYARFQTEGAGGYSRCGIRKRPAWSGRFRSTGAKMARCSSASRTAGRWHCAGAIREGLVKVSKDRRWFLPVFGSRSVTRGRQKSVSCKKSGCLKPIARSPRPTC